MKCKIKFKLKKKNCKNGTCFACMKTCVFTKQKNLYFEEERRDKNTFCVQVFSSTECRTPSVGQLIIFQQTFGGGG